MRMKLEFFSKMSLHKPVNCIQIHIHDQKDASFPVKSKKEWIEVPI